MQTLFNHLNKSHHAAATLDKSSEHLARLRQEVKMMLVSSDIVDAAWRRLDVNNSKSVTTSEWQTWVKSRWAFVSNAAATQAYQRTRTLKRAGNILSHRKTRRKHLVAP